MTDLSSLLVEAVSYGLDTQEVANVRSAYEFGLKYYATHKPMSGTESESVYALDQQRFATNKAYRTIRRTIDGWHRTQGDGVK